MNSADDKLGPGHYDTIHKSPGKYMTSDNKNNDGHRFSLNRLNLPLVYFQNLQENILHRKL